jgi:hypothetical protein
MAELTAESVTLTLTGSRDKQLEWLVETCYYLDSKFRRLSAPSFYQFLTINLMHWTDRELSAWLDEMLPADRMAELEQRLRSEPALQSRVSQLIHHRDQGGHTVGEIWQRAGLSCPSRSELGGYLLETLPAGEAQYIEFHLLTIGCRMCQANLNDLEHYAQATDETPARRRKFFESSAGLLNASDAEGFHSDGD